MAALLIAPSVSLNAATVNEADVKSVTVSVEALSGFFPTGEWTSDIKYHVVKAGDLEGVDQAMRLEVREGNQPWSMGTVVKTQEAVAEGDLMLASFELRSVESMTGQVLVNFIFQGGAPDWAKSAMVQVGAGTEWTTINLPFTAKGDYEAGEAMAGFHLSLADQTLEFADFKVLNFGSGYDINTLPNSDIAYEGREPDAAWRAVAAEKIEALRKGDLAVRVVGADGQPVEGAKVSVEMTRHAFPFGSAFAVSKLNLNSADGERYREEILNNFNSGVFESAMKWNNYGTGTPEQIAESMDWLGENNITMRGHVLMWPSWRWVDPDILPLRSDRVKFRQAIEDRVTDMVTLYKDDIHDWDVVNEAYSNNDILKMYGDEIMVDWFKLAHEAHPGAVLYVNDNDMVTAGGRDTKHMQHYEDMIQMLLDKGAPVGGIGMQGHFSTTLTSPENVWKTLDRFAKFDLPIKITEFDVKNEDPQVQADYQRDFLTAVFAHESIAGFVMWGFWEGQHWRPEAAMYSKDWTLRPLGKAYRDLVYGEWWTEENGTTDAQGHYQLRGFLGDYNITVTDGHGKTHESVATLSRDGETVEIRLAD
ncbi:MAG: endo-1,4-beta-xylanase [Planctomycetota bacterium]